MIPQIIWLFLQALNIIINAVKHGQEKKPSTLSSYIISFVLEFGLLIWGGFFSYISWPQIVIIILYGLIALSLIYIDKTPNKEETKPKYDVFSTAIVVVIITLIYLAGGFFKPLGF